MAALRILFICNKSPWPAKEGGPLAMYNLMEGLIAAGHHVKVLAVNSAKYHVDPEDIPAAFKTNTDIELVDIDLSIRFLPALANLFSSKSFHVQRFVSDDFERKLMACLQKETFDIVQMETLFMAPYLDTIRRFSRAKIVLRAHNIEHLIWKRMAANSRNALKKKYLSHLYRTLERYEKTILNRFDGILPITEKDAVFFRQYAQKPVYTLPFGVNLSDYLPEKKEVQPEHALFHIGAMNWMPNEEGIRWFLKHVWPVLHRSFPALKLYLAGRMMPAWLLGLQEENVEVAGEVPDARDFIRSKSISIAPLFSGSGVRIKIIESMSLEKAVVSTTTGAEGIRYTPGKNILIADTAEQFVEKISWLYQNPDKAFEVGKNARKLIESEHDIRKIIGHLEHFYREIL
jgi:glycosyltransferase involved in cell wall biosynthesis